MKQHFALPSLLVAAMLGAAAPGTLRAADDAHAAAKSRLEAAAGSAVLTTRDPAAGITRFVRLPVGSPADLAAGLVGSPDEKARGFFAAHGDLFGIADAARQLDRVAEVGDAQGYRHLTYQQFHGGVPVYGALLRTHFDATGRLTAVNGLFLPDVAIDVEARVEPETARTVALGHVAERAASAGGALAAGAPKLFVYRLGLDRGEPREDRLVWHVEVADGGATREFVMVDARLGKVVDSLPGVHDAMFRRAFLGTDGDGDNIPDTWPANPDWVEGNAIPSGNQQRDNMLVSTGDVYSVFNALGFDSYDDAGAMMDQAYNRNYSCPNASWNGLFISFCPGFTTHDVTAHEWGHAYTDYTHDLIYRWQSGALNESYSDLWGEAMDLQRTLPNMIDTDTPAGPRTDLCSAYQAVPPRLTVNSPGPIAGDYPVGTAVFGPWVTTQYTADVVMIDDETGADPNDGCEPASNAAEIAGKIGFANRGTCSFYVKQQNLQNAGAIAVVIGNVASSPTPETAPTMGCGTDPICPTLDYTIPSVSLNLENADLVRDNIAAPVNATIQPEDVGPTDDSLRWLMGEDVWGGALRDMWNPGCFGDPERVGDPNYWCDTGDNGGVHFNSGIPNHAFALLVDGGTFNGQTISALGFARVAQIYWRAQTVYQVPYSNFADHADALEAACADLVGGPHPDPWGGAPVMISGANCTEVAQAMLAVEMRAAPDCAFEPMFDPNAPPLCGLEHDYTVRVSDFESGADGFVASRRDVANPATFDPRDWTIDSSLPGGRAGAAFFAPDPVAGDCVADDESGVLVLQSPPMVMPIGGITPRLAFDHYMASELDWDGGNVKVSVDGGANWDVVPPSAFGFNPYVGPLASAGNTNPMAGEQAFHGTDGGSNSGSWGRSIVDLSTLVAPGQTFLLRFEFGSDGCNGSDIGWLVDDVNVFACTADPAIFLDGVETGGTERWSTAAR